MKISNRNNILVGSYLQEIKSGQRRLILGITEDGYNCYLLNSFSNSFGSIYYLYSPYLKKIHYDFEIVDINGNVVTWD